MVPELVHIEVGHFEDKVLTHVLAVSLLAAGHENAAGGVVDVEILFIEDWLVLLSDPPGRLHVVLVLEVGDQVFEDVRLHVSCRDFGVTGQVVQEGDGLGFVFAQLQHAGQGLSDHGDPDFEPDHLVLSGEAVGQPLEHQMVVHDVVCVGFDFRR